MCAPGLEMEKPQTDVAFTRVWDVLKKNQFPTFHLIGNHDLYNFKVSELRSFFNEDGGTQVTPISHSYHTHIALISHPYHACQSLAPYFGGAIT